MRRSRSNFYILANKGEIEEEIVFRPYGLATGV